MKSVTMYNKNKDYEIHGSKGPSDQITQCLPRAAEHAKPCAITEQGSSEFIHAFALSNN